MRALRDMSGGEGKILRNLLRSAETNFDEILAKPNC